MQPETREDIANRLRKTLVISAIPTMIGYSILVNANAQHGIYAPPIPWYAPLLHVFPYAFAGGWLVTGATARDWVRTLKRQAVQNIAGDGADPHESRPPVYNRNNTNPFFGKVRQSMADAIDAVREQIESAPPPQQQRAGSFQSAAPPVQATQRENPIRDLYAVTTRIYPLSPYPTRELFDNAYRSDGQFLYYKYVGKMAGTATCFADYGIWRHRRWIEQVDGRGKMKWEMTLDQCLQSDSRLWRYALAHGYTPLAQAA